MSEGKHDNANPGRLESLYGRAADAEPDARLDQAVLGRARQTARRSGWLGPWVYGLAGALCLVLVIGVGVQQGFQHKAPLELQEYRAAESELSEPADEPDSAPVHRRAFSPAAEPRQPPARPEMETKLQARDSLAGETPRRFWVQPPPDADTEEWLAHIRELWAADQAPLARQALETFRDSYPDAPVPPDLEDLLPVAEPARAREEP